MKNIIVQNDTYQFLTTGNSWSDEYPNAQIFTSLNQAKNAMKKNDETGEVDFIEDYGLESQKTVLTWKIAPDYPHYF